MIGPFRLAPFFSPRPWGSMNLEPWYPQPVAEPIGEAWLTGKDCLVESGEKAGVSLGELVKAFPGEILGPNGRPHQETDFPLLLKLLFPREKLSVQVHPDDALAATVGEPRGKTECWYVVRADAGASVALGLRPGTEPEAVRRGVADHTLEGMLNWIPVAAGEMIYVDAGTVHAIGPGAVLLETQQYSDVTYRLYDYGRPRELHVDAALRALRTTTDAGKVPPRHFPGYDQLIDQRYFAVERYQLHAGEERKLENSTGTVHSLVVLSGEAEIRSPGAKAVDAVPGRAIVVPGSCAAYTLTARTALTVVRAMPPANL